jgi:predicted AlkP superfamily phosphohydrolase/phosphomutase
MVIVGVDGADWKVIEWLWNQQRLPNLEQLAARGVSGPLETFHHASPVIWTTVATGVLPDVHGITEFVVPTATGDQPVSSSLRRVPALWNMLTASGRRVAVIGWWATWPAEQVSGVMVSDRALRALPNRVWPPDFETTLEAVRERLASDKLRPESLVEFDRVAASIAIDLVSEDYDLVLLYLRGVDIACHFHWRAFEPELFPPLDPADLEEGRESIAREYVLVDRTIGRIVAADPAANIIVMSDHGFRARPDEAPQIKLDFDVVLEHLGLLARDDYGGVDLALSEVYSYDSPDRSTTKKLRIAAAERGADGRVNPAHRASIRSRLEDALAGATWKGGSAAFTVRDTSPKEAKHGADLVVEVLTDDATRPLVIDGRPVPAAVRSIKQLSGTHGRKDPGIFIAAGPDIKPSAAPQSLRVIDVPPTVLYALGLPVGEDFAGRIRAELFTEAFRNEHGQHTIPTWGRPADGINTASDVDEELLDELRALGYIE